MLFALAIPPSSGSLQWWCRAAAAKSGRVCYFCFQGPSSTAAAFNKHALYLYSTSSVFQIDLGAANFCQATRLGGGLRRLKQARNNMTTGFASVSETAPAVSYPAPWARRRWLGRDHQSRFSKDARRNGNTGQAHGVRSSRASAAQLSDAFQEDLRANRAHPPLLYVQRNGLDADFRSRWVWQMLTNAC